jgi:hypothetical protein
MLLNQAYSVGIAHPTECYLVDMVDAVGIKCGGTALASKSILIGNELRLDGED